MTQLIELIDMLDGAGLIIEDPEAIEAELKRMGFNPQTEVDLIEDDGWDDDGWDDDEWDEDLTTEDQYFCQHGENKADCGICNDIEDDLTTIE